MQKTLQIPMVNLQRFHASIENDLLSTIQKVILSGKYVKSDNVREFEEQLSAIVDEANVISCGNGTDALQLAFMALNLQPGDEVITTPFTFISTVEVIALLKLKPVLVDIDPTNFNIDPKEIEKAISSKTKAIVPVHVFGQSAPMHRIMEIAKNHNLFVIEDACQALGTIANTPDEEYKAAGTIGHIGCTSFFPSKNLGALGDGGACFTRDKELAKKIRSLANHGMKRPYDHHLIGINSRLDPIQAEILKIKLAYFTNQIERKNEIANYYDDQLSSCDYINIPKRESYSTHSFHQYTLTVKDGKRDKLREYLKDNGIASGVYYPTPLHLQPGYQFMGYQQGDFPHAEWASQNVLSIPMDPWLTQEEQHYITNKIRAFNN
ncbi:DegT/DnrJ/EryC1/StrS family aminotransferase [Puteibacter caeruleilacunae]|nr:DegT/DnrJ/EryC1/StrS family aminotransferase [Puteibacter caeruleilacunae]